MTSAASPRHRRAIFVFVVMTVAVVLVDQVTKIWAVANLRPRLEQGEPPIEILGSALSLTFHANPGASFGIGSGNTWIFTAIAAVVVIAIIRVSARLASLPWAIAFGALLGGALGNLIDRLLREPGFGVGHVIDFIAFGDWFVNNIADIAITGGAVLMVVLSLLGVDVEGVHATPDEADTDSPA